MLVRDEKIIESMFVDSLKNIYSYIYAPEDKLPNHLIWDIVYKTFWKPYDKGYIEYEDIVAGGELRFEMGAEPACWYEI